MGYAPFPFSDWGGLDLRSEADEANGALDLLNADLDKPGAVRSRDGYTHLNATANPATIYSLFAWSSQEKLVASGPDGKLYIYNNAGTVDYTSGAYGGFAHSVAEFGTGTTPYLYAAFSATSIVRVTTAGAFSQPAGMPSANLIAVQPTDNRLAAVPTATTSRVKFSDPNDAETWGANNYAELTPNDGENINALVAWRDLLFAFKQSKFFVFTGNSEDGSGNPLFNRRTVQGVGTAEDPGMSVYAAAAPEGVYFFSTDGVYLTTGGPAVKVSSALDPWFMATPTPYDSIVGPFLWNNTGGATVDGAYLTYLNNRLYCSVGDAGNSGARYILVYDTTTREWVLWQTANAAACLAGIQLTHTTPKRLAFVAGGTRIYTQTASDTTDDGAGITGRYRSPYVNLNYIRRQRKWLPITSQESTVRESILDGTGTVGYSLARDWATSPPTTGGGRKGIVKLGASVPAQGRHRYAQRGRAMSSQFETPTASDDFSTNTIANYTADVGATSNVTITGGVMDASANFSTQNALILTTGTFTDFGDCVVQAKHTLGTTLTAYAAGVAFKRVSSTKALRVYVTDSGVASTLVIEKRDGVTQTILSSTAITRLTVSTAYWIRARIEGNVITAEHFTANPSGAVAATSATYTLTGSDATTHGSGIIGKTGLLFVPQQTAASLDDFSVVGGAWKVEDLVWHLTGVRQSGVQTT